MIFLQTYTLLIGSANCRVDAMSLAFLIKPNLHIAGLGIQVSYVWGSCRYLCISFQLLSIWIVPLEDNITLLYMLEYLAFFSDIWQTPHTTTVPSRFSEDWVSQEEERKYICPDLPWRKSASGAFFVPGLFFFKDDEKSSNVSRAHSTHSTCLTNGLWADLRACKPNISMDQSCEISKY